MSAKLYCTECGAKVAPQGLYCPSCGHKLGGENTGTTIQEKHEMPNRRKRINPLVIGVVAIVVCLLAVVLFNAATSDAEYDRMCQRLYEWADAKENFPIGVHVEMRQPFHPPSSYYYGNKSDYFGKNILDVDIVVRNKDANRGYNVITKGTYNDMSNNGTSKVEQQTVAPGGEIRFSFLINFRSGERFDISVDGFDGFIRLTLFPEKDTGYPPYEEKFVYHEEQEDDEETVSAVLSINHEK